MSVDLDTTNNIWQMSVGYSEGFAAPWLKGLTALVVILSVAISLLLMTILVAKKDMKVLLYKMMPPVVVAKLRRGETVVQRYDLSTIFFSDIVGETSVLNGMILLISARLLNIPCLSLRSRCPRKKHEATSSISFMDIVP